MREVALTSEVSTLGKRNVVSSREEESFEVKCSVIYLSLREIHNARVSRYNLVAYQVFSFSARAATHSGQLVESSYFFFYIFIYFYKSCVTFHTRARSLRRDVTYMSGAISVRLIAPSTLQ